MEPVVDQPKVIRNPHSRSHELRANRAGHVIDKRTKSTLARRQIIATEPRQAEAANFFATRQPTARGLNCHRSNPLAPHALIEAVQIEQSCTGVDPPNRPISQHFRAPIGIDDHDLAAQETSSTDR
jgi:hypothetical protein